MGLGINEITDNRALQVKCYLPEYTFIEKLQTISTKYRVNQQRQIESPINFIRHYYDVYQLLNTERVKKFLHTPEYKAYKREKFVTLDELDLTKNPAFQLSFPNEMEKFSLLYQKKQKSILKKLQRLLKLWRHKSECRIFINSRLVTHRYPFSSLLHMPTEIFNPCTSQRFTPSMIITATNRLTFVGKWHE